MEQLKSRIEAVLFVTAKVLQIKDIAEILEEEPEKVEYAKRCLMTGNINNIKFFIQFCTSF